MTNFSNFIETRTKPMFYIPQCSCIPQNQPVFIVRWAVSSPSNKSFCYSCKSCSSSGFFSIVNMAMMGKRYKYCCFELLLTQKYFYYGGIRMMWVICEGYLIYGHIFDGLFFLHSLLRILWYIFTNIKNKKKQ